MFSFFRSSEITVALSRNWEGGTVGDHPPLPGYGGATRRPLQKQNAGPKAGVSNCFVVDRLSTVVMNFDVLVMVMMTMLSADVVAVNPLMVVVGPMTLHPNHFIIALIITWAVAVIRPVTDLNAKALRSRGGRK